MVLVIWGMLLIACVIALPSSKEEPSSAYDPIVFQPWDVPGVSFITNSSRTPHKHQPETMVSGVGLLDYNNDGLLDIYAVNGASMPGLEKTSEIYFNRLFKNDGDGTFEDVTEKAGVRGQGYDMGVAVGDYDNDGYSDIFVAGLRENSLYHNNANGTFTDVTAKAGLALPDPKYKTLWAVAAAWLDYDKDGYPDLFVSNYCVWDPKKEPICRDTGQPDYCHPRLYNGLPNSLFRNNHDGTFTDVSEVSGIRKHIGKGMGIGVADFDGDAWTDIFLANDTIPAFLFHNKGDGTFSEIGVEAGVAYTERGLAVSGMGVDARDLDNDGWPDIFETAMIGETMPFFRNLGRNLFEDKTLVRAITDIYTGVGEVKSVYFLGNLLWRVGQPFRVERSLLLTWEDLKAQNIVCLGGPAENLQLRRLPQEQEFVFKFEGIEGGPPKFVILNRKPQPGEQTRYAPVVEGSSQSTVTEDYALVSMLKGLDPNRRLLILAGVTTFGTQACTEYVTRSETLTQLIQQLNVSRDSAKPKLPPLTTRSSLGSRSIAASPFRRRT